jgi:hypothetical protein
MSEASSRLGDKDKRSVVPWSRKREDRWLGCLLARDASRDVDDEAAEGIA